MTTQKRILLIIGGGIAAYKSLDLIRRLRENNLAVRVVLTRAAEEFITPLSAAALSGDKVFTDLFAADDEAAMGHIQLSRNADLVLVCPATADLMAKMATGQASDLASTLLLATDKPVLAAPAMNVRMWHHPATQRNLAILREDGVGIIMPEEGSMACGEYGLGRLAETGTIIEAVTRKLDNTPHTTELPLKGKKILITSGPTHEPIDPVRMIANRSSGKQGHAIAAAAIKAGAEVTLISGPVTLPDPVGARVIHVETALEMLDAVKEHLPADVAVFAAAVADWRVENAQTQKITKSGSLQPPRLEMIENPDILATVSRLENIRPTLVIGFAAETENVLERAMAKRQRKQCDWIIANDVSPQADVFGNDDNRAFFITENGIEAWKKQPKTAVAEKIIEKVANFFSLKGMIST